MPEIGIDPSIIQAVELTAGDAFKVTLTNGNVAWVPDTMKNRHRRIVQAWIEEGNVPTPYVAPPKSTIPPQAEMVKALWEKSRGDSTRFDGLDAKVGF